jgi:predicted aspartyl protease
MGVKIGYLDSNGHPNVKIRIWGMAEQFAQEFEAMIDTGFTGFLSMPLTAAFPLALTLFGTTSYTLADGSVSPKLLGYGTVELEGEQADGSIVLESKSSGLLLGMEFLRKLNKALVVSKTGVLLIDDPAPVAPTPPDVPPALPDPAGA